MEVVPLLDRIVQDLEQNPNHLRMKKLILCICRGVWENDRHRLDQIDLKDLIQELVELTPSLGDLKLAFGNAVRTLNKKAEYSLLANTILGLVKPLYPEDMQLGEQETQEDLYEEVSQNFQTEADLDRIKKLLFAACGHPWENEIAKIDEFKLSALVQTIHEIHPTLQDLNHTLSKVVGTLNKQQEYAEIASIILDLFGPLYPDRSESTRVVSETNSVPHPDAQSESGASPVVAGAASYQENASTAQASKVPPSPLPRRLFDPFELRISTIRYANPLRVKILAFSALEQLFTFSERDWLSLRDRQIDDLLQELFFSHETLSELEHKLRQTAQEFADSSEYMQVISVLMQVLKPLYETRSQVL